MIINGELFLILITQFCFGWLSGILWGWKEKIFLTFVILLSMFIIVVVFIMKPDYSELDINLNILMLRMIIQGIGMFIGCFMINNIIGTEEWRESRKRLRRRYE